MEVAKLFIVDIRLNFQEDLQVIDGGISALKSQVSGKIFEK